MKEKKKYRIRIEDESHLNEVADFSIGRWQLRLTIVAGILLIALLTAVIIWLTPLSSLFQRNEGVSSRSVTEENLLRLDSLNKAYSMNQAFIDNFFKVTDIHRNATDSAEEVRALESFSREESLMEAGASEKKFVGMMEQQERFNISVLAPLAADGMIFSPLSTEGIISTATRGASEVEVILPPLAPVLSAADGVVAGLFPSPSSNGNSIIIQHSRGFLSCYSHLGQPLVDEGDIVAAGQVIALTPNPDRKGIRRFFYRLWHNRISVKPAEYVDFGIFD